MKISAANAAFFQNRFKAVLHGAWFYRFVSSRKNIARPSVLFQNIQDKCRKRNISHRGFALGRGNYDRRSAFAGFIGNTLKRFRNADNSAFKINIIPCKRAKFPNAKPRIHCQQYSQIAFGEIASEIIL